MLIPKYELRCLQYLAEVCAKREKQIFNTNLIFKVIRLTFYTFVNTVACEDSCRAKFFMVVALVKADFCF